MGGSFQSLHPVVFGHGFDRMAADNFLCQLCFKARKVLWPWSQGTAETLLAQLSVTQGTNWALSLTVQLFCLARNSHVADDADASPVFLP